MQQCLEIRKSFGEHANLIDQDALNVLFRENYRKLPTKFNYDVRRARKEGKSKIEPAIYHYMGRSNSLDASDIFNRLWFEYFCHSPFCDAQTFDNMFRAIQKFTMDYTKIWHEILKISNTNRSFPVDSLGFEEIRDFFNAQHFIDNNQDIFDSHNFLKEM